MKQNNKDILLSVTMVKVTITFFKVVYREEKVPSEKLLSDSRTFNGFCTRENPAHI